MIRRIFVIVLVIVFGIMPFSSTASTIVDPIVETTVLPIEDEALIQIVDPEILSLAQVPLLVPGNSLYFIKSFVESFKLLLTRNAENRAYFLSALALERAKELATLVANEASDALIIKTVNRQELILANLTTLSAVPDFPEAMLDKVMETQAKVLTKLSLVLPKVSETAQNAIITNIMRRSENIIEHMEKKAGKLAEQTSNKLNAALVYAVSSADKSTSMKEDTRAKLNVLKEKTEKQLQEAENQAEDKLGKLMIKVNEQLTANKHIEEQAKLLQQVQQATQMRTKLANMNKDKSKTK